MKGGKYRSLSLPKRLSFSKALTRRPTRRRRRRQRRRRRRRGIESKNKCFEPSLVSDKCKCRNRRKKPSYCLFIVQVFTKRACGRACGWVCFGLTVNIRLRIFFAIQKANDNLYFFCQRGTWTKIKNGFANKSTSCFFSTIELNFFWLFI